MVFLQRHSQYTEADLLGMDLPKFQLLHQIISTQVAEEMRAQGIHTANGLAPLFAPAK